TGCGPVIAAAITGPQPVSDLLAWNACRALLRCGDPTVIEAIRPLSVDAARPGWVRSMARHALVTLDPPAERAAIRANLAPEVVAAIDDRRVEALAERLGVYSELLDEVYLAGGAEAILGLLPLAPLTGARFLGIRRVFKAAEARADAAVYGLVVRRFEREPCGGNRPAQRGRWVISHTEVTRRYLRRRSWRTLRRLGEVGAGPEYCRMAAGVLLAYTDADAAAPRMKRTSRRLVVTDRFSADWALSHILFHHSARFEAAERSLVFRVVRAAAGSGPVTAREEAFPRLWDDAPELLAELLDRSRCAEVHGFAGRALRANRDAWHRIAVPQLIGWFAAPYAGTAELAAEVAVTRYDPADPDLELVSALLSSSHAAARTTAESWVRANPAVFLRSPSFVARIVLSPVVETRRLALEVLAAATLLPDHATAVVEAVLDAAMRAIPGDDAVTLQLRDAAAVILATFSREAAALPLDRVAALLRHPAEGTAELGAKILLGHRVRPAELPDDLLAAAMTSAFPVVRGIAIRLYGELPDAVLAERFRVLVHLVTNPHPDVRHAVTPIVVRLAATNPMFAKVLLAGLIPALTGGGPGGDDDLDDTIHRDVVRLLRVELASSLPLVEPAVVFRLLRARMTVVQELGGELLRTNVDPRTTTPTQLAILASSDVLGVRRTAWAMLGARVEDVRRDPDAVLPLVDARWEDSRQRAFAFVETEVGAEHLPAEVVLAVCDSVRPDVQAFGRRLVTQRFDQADGPRYLLRLAQHPSPEMQAFAASWLESHAAGDPDRLQVLAPFVVSVLCRPNRGRVAKLRVLAFLESQVADPRAAALIAGIAGELVLTVASSHRERYVGLLATIRRLHPDLPSPLRVIPPEARGGAGAV
ncbi:MAG: hypothetical protein ABMB14_27060, partial [Myxococcota bacterium]